jgi:hypothetical protein
MKPVDALAPGLPVCRYIKQENRRQVCVGIAPLTISEFDPELESELLFGETVEVLEWGFEKVRVRSEVDHSVGWIDRAHLSETIFNPTHWICVPITFALEENAVQSREIFPLGMCSRVQVIEEGGYFCKLWGAGWVHKSTIAPINETAGDYVEVALRFTGPERGSPYGWGGRSGRKLDCSALVQLSLMLSGHTDVPRNSGEQRKTLGVRVRVKDGFRRGDFVFWKGHVAVMTSSTMLVHATGNGGMAVIEEPLEDVRIRLRKQEGKKILAVRRLPNYHCS